MSYMIPTSTPELSSNIPVQVLRDLQEQSAKDLDEMMPSILDRAFKGGL